MTLTALLEDIAGYMDFSVLANNEQAVNYDHLYGKAPVESQEGYDHLEPVQSVYEILNHCIFTQLQ